MDPKFPSWAILVAAGAALALPAGLNAYWLHVMIMAYFYAIVTASWTLLVGYAGQFSFGHVAFVAIGGYTSGLLVAWLGIPIPFGMGAGVVASLVIGAAIGWICLRMQGPYLAIFTMAFAEVIRIVIVTEDEVTGGAGGLSVQALFGTQTDLPYYYFALGLLVASLLVMVAMVRSRWGLFFRAIRENERAAAACGVHVIRFRILVFAVASAFAGLAGSLYAHYIGILTPDIGSLDNMGLVVAMAVIGGSESLAGGVVGAVGVEVLSQLLQGYGQWRFVLFGALLVLTMRFARNGLLPIVLKLLSRVGGFGRIAGLRREIG